MAYSLLEIAGNKMCPDCMSKLGKHIANIEVAKEMYNLKKVLLDVYSKLDEINKKLEK